MSEKLDASLQVKMKKSELQAFAEKCTGSGRSYTAVVREMVTAFNEGRLKIKPTENQKQTLGEMYDD